MHLVWNMCSHFVHSQSRGHAGTMNAWRKDWETTWHLCEGHQILHSSCLARIHNLWPPQSQTASMRIQRSRQLLVWAVDTWCLHPTHNFKNVIEIETPYQNDGWESAQMANETWLRCMTWRVDNWLRCQMKVIAEDLLRWHMKLMTENLLFCCDHLINATLQGVSTRQLNTDIPRHYLQEQLSV